MSLKRKAATCSANQRRWMQASHQRAKKDLLHPPSTSWWTAPQTFAAFSLAAHQRARERQWIGKAKDDD